MKMNTKRHRPMSDINVVPYIDVMLVLLIIFMVTAPMLMQGVQVDLPKVESDPFPVDKNKEPLIVSIDANGAYYLELGDQERSKTPLELSQVSDAVRKVLVQNPGVGVLVRGDTHVEYGAIVRLMGVIQDAGAPGVGLITENP